MSSSASGRLPLRAKAAVGLDATTGHHLSLSTAAPASGIGASLGGGTSQTHGRTATLCLDASRAESCSAESSLVVTEGRQLLSCPQDAPTAALPSPSLLLSRPDPSCQTDSRVPGDDEPDVTIACGRQRSGTQLLDLPNEVLLEILGYLDVCDVLSTSRVSFHALLGYSA